MPYCVMFPLRMTDRGLACEAGGFHIDPWGPVERAVITHAHADHTCKGCRHYLASREGRHVLRTRLGNEASIQLLEYGEALDLNGYRLSHKGVSVDAFVFNAREAELARLMPAKKAADTSKKLLCPMPGLVKAVTVSEGQDVKAGDSLAVVEAMKMENSILAHIDRSAAMDVREIYILCGSQESEELDSAGMPPSDIECK